MNKEKIFNEEWLDILGFEGLYQVSNLGRVKSLGNGNSNASKERILKPRKNKFGYLLVNLYKDGKQKTQYVHLTVAKAFLPNPDNLPCVNHKDEDKTNNRVDNLEWCTHEYNCNWGTRNQRRVEKLSKEVIQMDLDGNEIARFISTNEVQRQLGFNRGNISLCCNGSRQTSYGYIWKYA